MGTKTEVKWSEVDREIKSNIDKLVSRMTPTRSTVRDTEQSRRYLEVISTVSSVSEVYTYLQRELVHETDQKEDNINLLITNKSFTDIKHCAYPLYEYIMEVTHSVLKYYVASLDGNVGFINGLIALLNHQKIQIQSQSKATGKLSEISEDEFRRQMVESLSDSVVDASFAFSGLCMKSFGDDDKESTLALGFSHFLIIFNILYPINDLNMFFKEVYEYLVKEYQDQKGVEVQMQE